jgi:hypothetical protein
MDVVTTTRLCSSMQSVVLSEHEYERVVSGDHDAPLTTLEQQIPENSTSI